MPLALVLHYSRRVLIVQRLRVLLLQRGRHAFGCSQVAIEVSIGDGPGTGMAWGCDLSYDYVKINAEYTT